MVPSGSRRATILIAIAIGLCACGSNTAAPSAPAGTGPMISNLTATFQASDCTREFPGNRGVTGTTLSFVFGYVAAGGNLQGGHVQLNRVYSTGDSEMHTWPIPAEATVTGTTSGQVRVGGCPRYNDATASTETVSLYDANNHVSNSLTVTVTRPSGAP
jgi:hypothetical protein